MTNFTWIISPQTPEDRFRLTLIGALIIHTVVLIGISIHSLKSDSIPLIRPINVTLQQNSDPNYETDLHQTKVDAHSTAKSQDTKVSKNFSKPINNPNIVVTRNSTQSFEHKILKKPNKQLTPHHKNTPILIAQPLRKRTISSASHENRDKSYLARWQAYLEDVGNQNYPKAALDNNIRGNLRLMVAINKDGTVNNVKIRQSSGHKILDNAALIIISKAAPFEPLPDEIAQDVDILEIIRTWQFRGNFVTS